MAWAFAAGSARAATPFGGDDQGFVPPDTDNFKYESKVGKNVTKYVKCHLKCHEKRAKLLYPDATTEENCENACKGKYDAANAKLTAPVPASMCINTDAVRQFWHGVIDLFNNQIYCEGMTPFGGDDTGNIPSTKDSFNCEKKVGLNVAKLMKCQNTCHTKRAQGKITDAATEETCEDTCGTKYDNANAKITGCPPCQSASNQMNLGTTMRTQGDLENGQVYCAQ